MEKLLHERLRECGSDDFCLYNVMISGPGCRSGSCQECCDESGKAIADEIERYYIPRPRFEDGEPVQFGDEVELHYKAGGCDKGRMQSFHPNSGPVWMLSFVGCDHELLYRYDSEADVLKRPAPKVLDADGVEIKVGDTVYDISDGHESVVESVTMMDSEGNTVRCKDGAMGELHYKPDQLTHEPPAFDAEGERIRKGDTVWHTGDFERGTVIDSNAVDSTFGKQVQLKVAWDNGNEGIYRGDCLTHREPDSLERLRDDMKRNSIDPVPSEINAWVDRLAALIERSAK